MATIISLSYWYDVGYQRNAYIVPSKTDTLPAPKGTFTFPTGDARPSTQDIFRAINLPYAYTKLYKAGYISLNLNTSDERLTLYAWVDDVQILSDNSLPITRITYTIDFWRTYLSKATFSYGLVQNRPKSLTDPIQNCSYRYRLPTKTVPLYQSDIRWLIISAQNIKSDKTKITSVRTMIIPLGSSPTQKLWLKARDKTVQVPTFQDLLDGSWDEKLNIDPDSVNSAFVSPIPPLPYTLDGTTVIIQTTGEPSIEKVTDTKEQPNGGYFFWATDGNTGSVVYYDSNGDAKEPETGLTVAEIKSRMVTWNGNLSYRNKTITQRIYEDSAGGVEYNESTYIWVGTIDELAKEALGTLYDTDKLTVTDRFSIVSSNVLYVEGELTSVTSFSNSSATVTRQYASIDTSAHVFSWQPSTQSFGDQEIIIFGQPATVQLTHSKVSYVGDNDIQETSVIGDVTYGYAYNGSGYYQEINLSLSEEMTTTETSELLVTDMSAVPIAALPWGIKIKEYTVRVIHSPLSAYVEFRFRGIDSFASGTIATVPLPSVDLTTNAVTSYQISGQRDYDMRQRQIASEQALIQGVSSAVTGGFSNAVFASIGGGKRESVDKGTSLVTGKDGKLGWGTAKFTTGMQPSVAGVASVGLGAATSVIEYGLSLYHNGQLQKAEDQLKAKQAESLIAEGTGWDWVWHGRDISIVALEIDSYSQDRYVSDIEWNGISCSEPTSDITPLINQGGPLRISNAIVGGEIPVQARNFISNMLERGVYIDTRNTSQ